MCVSFDIFCNYYSVSIQLVGLLWGLIGYWGGVCYTYLQRSGVLGFPVGVSNLSKLLGRGCAW